MEINWLTKLKQPPIIFNNGVDFEGIQVYHRKALAGEMPEYVHLSHALNVTLSGNCKAEKQLAAGGKKSYCREKGNICLIPSKQPHSASWNDYYECLTIELEPQKLKQIVIENDLESDFEMIEADRGEDLLIPQIGLELVRESLVKNPVGKLYADSLAHTLVMHILRNYTSVNFGRKKLQGGLSGYKLKLVTEYINDNLDKELSLQGIAEIADLSRFHFSRSFRKSVGMTPQQYLMKQRVEKAKLLLVDTNLPLVEVGFQTGFKNQSHFTSLFRRFTRITPKVWRDIRHA